jgi:uncharacterized BrkB/YihY/UPF0761 family membrane protein
MTQIFLNWVDLLWIPVVLLFMYKDQKFKSIIFVLMCILVLRLQVELMSHIGYENGVLPFFTWPALYRGFLVYGLFIGLFLFMARISKEKNPYIFMAAGISMFIFAFITSIAVMFL